MAAITSVSSSPKWLVLMFMALVFQNQMAQSQTQTCSNSLANLNVCAQFVVPGAANTSPSPDCCTALQGLEHDCICNTLRIAARLPALCNLPPLSCGAN
ncbi:stamen-specific protein FIL1-like isoform X1 [Olea europaea var. sylvestris]|uniref:stamen-specific protein FIL1-like isoform X1 n=1 Tax=Olea europaea var. sylvestris TaxID=158386 RepID=UPI000C1CEFB8|nr:stamen-specific protein FIL1-like isoform X1 [Olea europaea var. sylvestris]